MNNILTINNVRKIQKKWKIEIYMKIKIKTCISSIFKYFYLNIHTHTMSEIREPQYSKKNINKESDNISKLAKDLGLDKHPNGGYFKETDRSKETYKIKKSKGENDDSKEDYDVRNQSSLIHFLMSCESPIGRFHTNINSRTIHILQKGRGKYILVHQNGQIETFTVGFDIEKGERTQWVVEPGVYKGCYLIGDESDEDCLWVSEVVVPGFDFTDMKFINEDELKRLVGDEKGNNLKFLI